MRSPTIAIAWQMWRRCRVWGTISLTYFALVAALAWTLPVGLASTLTVFALATPLILTAIGLMRVVTYGDSSDLLTTESQFPSYLLRLPYDTRPLVAWPMLYGGLAAAVMWIAFMVLVVQARGVATPLGGSALLVVAVLVWLQALLWTPFGMPYGRLTAVLLLLAALFVLGMLIAAPRLADDIYLPRWGAPVAAGLAIPCAYLAAALGVARARRGDSPDWSGALEKLSALVQPSRISKRPFKSATAAQVWWELRRYCHVVLWLTALIVLLIAAVLVWKHFDDRPARFVVSPLALLSVPLFVLFCQSSSFGCMGGRKSEADMSSFLAVRPLSSAQFVQAKLLAAGFATLAAYAFAAAAMFAVWAIIGWEREAAVVELLREQGYNPLLLTIAGGGLLLFIGWRSLVDNIFVGLTGRVWLLMASSAAIVPVMFAVPLTIHWYYLRPESFAGWQEAAPYLLWGIVALKLLLAAGLFRTLVRCRLLDKIAALRIAALWLLAWAALFALFCWLIPVSLLPPATAAAAAVLTTPLVRLSLAPLALAWNRHR